MKSIHTVNAPKAIGPYSQAILINDFLYTSGQIAIDPKEGTIVAGGIEEQTHQVFKNLIEILKTEEYSLNDIIKTTVFVKDLNDFQKVNSIYAEYFKEHKPARSTVQVARLPMDALIEIEVIAKKDFGEISTPHKPIKFGN